MILLNTYQTWNALWRKELGNEEKTTDKVRVTETYTLCWMSGLTPNDRVRN